MPKTSTIPNNNKNIAYLKGLIKRRGIKQNWLASELGVSATYLNYILKGKRNPENLSEIVLKAEKIILN